MGGQDDVTWDWKNLEGTLADNCGSSGGTLRRGRVIGATGLCFTEVRICSRYECLFSNVRLTETYARTLVRLLYTIPFHCKFRPPPPVRLVVARY